MPFFQPKKKKVDVTRHWVGDTRFPLELDLSRNSLSGVRIGGAVDGFMRLGPAEDPEAADDEVYRYFSRGLEITADDGFVTAYRFVFSPAEGFRPFRGGCFFRGVPVELSASSTEADIRAAFGPPYWRDHDEEEILLFFEFGNIEWQVELDASGKLSQWTMLSPPSMANSDQREAYNVTAPWPPSASERIRPRFARTLLRHR